MNTIAAINTTYKGYRFRSRLEARWAMFFDAIGVAWSYEADPLSVSGEAYLPDFILKIGGREIIHEVKSLHEKDRIKATGVYLAGKMDPEHCWRGGCHLDLSSNSEYLFRGRRTMDGATFKLTGPHRLGGKHYEFAADWARHEAENDESPIFGTALVDRCFASIQDADLVCLHLSTADAHGSLVEIGFARALGRTISVTVEKHLAVVPERWLPPHDGQGRIAPRHDLWFAQTVANSSAIVDDAQEARRFHAEFIAANTAREYRLISRIGMTRPALLTFGDPFDMAFEGKFEIWDCYPDVKPWWGGHREVAARVRAHRFDGR